LDVKTHIRSDPFWL